MTQDEIIEMAEKCGVAIWHTYMHVGKEELEALAKLIAEKEREACAKIADEWSGHYQANEIAKAIRERNND